MGKLAILGLAALLATSCGKGSIEQKTELNAPTQQTVQLKKTNYTLEEQIAAMLQFTASDQKPRQINSIKIPIPKPESVMSKTGAAFEFIANEIKYTFVLERDYKNEQEDYFKINSLQVSDGRLYVSPDNSSGSVSELKLTK